MKRKLFLLIFWIVAALFPFGWLTVCSNTYSRVFNFVFDTPLSHVILHAAIFCGLMILLAVTFGGNAPARGRHWALRLLFLWGVVALVAGSQEWIQLLYKARQSGADEYFDIGVDMSGAAVGLIVIGSYGRVVKWSRSWMK